MTPVLWQIGIDVRRVRWEKGSRMMGGPARLESHRFTSV